MEARTAGVWRIMGMDTDCEQSRLGVYLDLTSNICLVGSMRPRRQYAFNRFSHLFPSPILTVTNLDRLGKTTIEVAISGRVERVNSCPLFHRGHYPFSPRTWELRPCEILRQSRSHSLLPKTLCLNCCRFMNLIADSVSLQTRSTTTMTGSGLTKMDNSYSIFHGEISTIASDFTVFSHFFRTFGLICVLFEGDSVRRARVVAAQNVNISQCAQCSEEELNIDQTSYARVAC